MREKDPDYAYDQDDDSEAEHCETCDGTGYVLGTDGTTMCSDCKFWALCADGAPEDVDLPGEEDELDEDESEDAVMSGGLDGELDEGFNEISEDDMEDDEDLE